jgi:hypothetical protein
MARDFYSLSDETRLVLSHNPEKISEEMGKHKSFAYDFLEMRRTDPFAILLPIYNASIRTGAPYCHWDNRMAASRSRYEQIYPKANTVQCLKDKLKAHNETILKFYEAIEDGQLTDREIADIQALIADEIEELTRLNLQLSFQRGQLNNKSANERQTANGRR